ncbi:MAG: hypothetical protein GY810_00565 [Aureispira sp.]|nr:hypothetical protein [Aureispira sp.]
MSSKIELSHDSLAKTIYEKVSAEDKRRLKVANFIHTRYAYYNESRTLLKKDDLRYIASYVDSIDLTTSQLRFIAISRFASRKQAIATWAVAIAILITFVVLWNRALEWGKKESLARMDLNEKKIELDTKIAYQKILIDSLRYKDSLHEVLIMQANDADSAKQLSRAELQEALNEMAILTEQLEKTNKQLKVAQKALEASLIEEKAARQRIQKSYNKLNSRVSGQSGSHKLSRAAQKFLSKERPSESDYKKAFQLARAAWNMDKDNSQAMDIINLIGHKKVPKNSGGYLSKDIPKVTYSHSKIKRIIQEVDAKKRYGSMGKSDLARYLR